MTIITVVLHNIRSTHNVGSIFRTCEGLGVNKIILTGYTPYPTLPERDTRLPHIREKITKDIHKTALGAEMLVPFEQFDELEPWLDTLDSSVSVVALEQSARSVLLDDYITPKRLVLILGEEVHGVTDTILARCNEIVEIPMRGKKESFNVSVAAAIALYKFTR